jgi:hypothetical protein
MRSRERCERCNVGKMHVDTVRTAGSRRVRYLQCTECKHRGKEVCALDDLGRPVYSLPIGSTLNHSNNVTQR